MRPGRILVRMAIGLGIAAGALVPMSAAEAATTEDVVKDSSGKALAIGQFNSGMSGFHSGKSNTGVNSFDLVDLECGDGKSVGVTWSVKGEGVVHIERKPDCFALFPRKSYGIQTGQAWDQMMEMSWYVWTEDKDGNRDYGSKFQDDWMGTYSYKQDSKYFYHYSIYKDWVGDKKSTVLTLGPTEYTFKEVTAEDTKTIWNEMKARTPLPSDLIQDQQESLYKQLFCHARWAHGLGGPTWDLEADRPNIPWDEVAGPGDVKEHECNWGPSGGYDYDYLAYLSADRGNLTELPKDLSPVVSAGPDRTSDEGSSAKLDGYAADDHEVKSTKWSYGPIDKVDPGTSCSFGDASKSETTFTCNDDGRFVLTLQADDGVNPPVRDHTIVTVKNVPPKLTLKSPTDWDVHRVESKVGVEATFTDPGSNDTHTCKVAWDDGKTSEYAAAEKSCGTSHVFEHAGMYSTDITVADDDGGSDQAEAMVVVYDPRAGLLTGLGTVDKLHFTVAAKYVSADSTVPAGTVVLNLPDRHTIASIRLDWLVITPDGKAAVKGRGVSHGFLGYAESGKFRGVVWLLSEGKVPPTDRAKLLYDTSPGASWDIDEAKPAQVSTGVSVIDTGWIPGLPSLPSPIDLGSLLDGLPVLGVELF